MCQVDVSADHRNDEIAHGIAHNIATSVGDAVMAAAVYRSRGHDVMAARIAEAEEELHSAYHRLVRIYEECCSLDTAEPTRGPLPA